MKLKELEDMLTIAYYSGYNGIEIKGFEFGVENYILCISGAWAGKRHAHRVKIHTNTNGSSYFKVDGHHIPLSECIRCGF